MSSNTSRRIVQFKYGYFIIYTFVILDFRVFFKKIFVIGKKTNFPLESLISKETVLKGINGLIFSNVKSTISIKLFNSSL